MCQKWSIKCRYLSSSYNLYLYCNKVYRKDDRTGSRNVKGKPSVKTLVEYFGDDFRFQKLGSWQFDQMMEEKVA